MSGKCAAHTLPMPARWVGFSLSWLQHLCLCADIEAYICFISKNMMQAGFIKSHKQQVSNIKGSVGSERPALSPGPRLWDLMHHSLISEDEGRPSPSLESLQSPELRAVLSTLQASSKAPSRAAKTMRERQKYNRN